MTTIYDALATDHREFEMLLDQLVATSKTGGDTWKTSLDTLRRSLIPHAHAEEAVFYNALREMGHGKDLVMRSYSEHAMAETEIRALGAAKLIDVAWTTMAEKLRKDLTHHIREEEARLFTAARAIFSDAEATQLGAAFLRLKVELAKDGDSFVASTVDLVANLLPPRLTGSFRKHVSEWPRAQ